MSSKKKFETLEIEREKFIRVVSMDEKSTYEFCRAMFGFRPSDIEKIVDVGPVDMSQPYYREKYRDGARHFHVYTKEKREKRS